MEHSFFSILRRFASFVFGAAAAVFVVALIAHGATTINDNISTGGTLSVTGNVYASSTLQATGNAFFYGNVGIGTTSPVVPLEVAGGIQSTGGGYSIIQKSGESGGGAASIQGFSTGAARLILFDNVTPRRWDIMTSATSEFCGTATDGSFCIDDATGGDKPRLVINTSGNVGIGTTSPANIISASSAATTTLYLDSTAVGTCIQMRSAGTLKNPVKVFFDDSGGLKSEVGSC